MLIQELMILIHRLHLRQHGKNRHHLHHQQLKIQQQT
jgi:hypothetical protein